MLKEQVLSVSRNGRRGDGKKRRRKTIENDKGKVEIGLFLETTRRRRAKKNANKQNKAHVRQNGKD